MALGYWFKMLRTWESETQNMIEEKKNTTFRPEDKGTKCLGGLILKQNFTASKLQSCDSLTKC